MNTVRISSNYLVSFIVVSCYAIFVCTVIFCTMRVSSFVKSFVDIPHYLAP